MKKLLILSLIFFVKFLSFFVNAYADEVEEVFSDIDKNFKYYNELQTLYDNGAINPDENGLFNPEKLLNRDEFVGIAMEVSCKKCIQPNVSLSILNSFENSKPFYDLGITNRYFYCVSAAYENNAVRGYKDSHMCDNKTQKQGEAPFCPNNLITLEEAVAVLLRNSSIFTIEDNNKILNDIQTSNGDLTLKGGIKPFLNDKGGIYTFYGYFKKGLELKISEYDIYGKKVEHNFIDIPENGIIDPNKKITKEEFLKMAYIIGKLNSCNQGDEDLKGNQKIPTQIKIMDKDCTKEDNCDALEDFPREELEYDYGNETNITCEKGVKSYTRLFSDRNTGETTIKHGDYIDNYKFPYAGDWIIKLYVLDNCGNSGYSEAFISNVDKNNDKDNKRLEDPNDKIEALIKARPLVGSVNTNFNFKAITKCKNCSYSWDFGNGSTDKNKNTQNKYDSIGNYEVTLIVTNPNGKKATAKVNIKVVDENDLDKGGKEKEWGEKDDDGDGVLNKDDMCPNVKGPPENYGCPILEKKCSVDADCGPGFSCIYGYCKPSNDANFSSYCLTDNNSSIFGSIEKESCNTCPCKYNFSFNSNLRKCDIVIPAITSNDNSLIFSRGNPYEIPFKKE